MVNSGFRAAPNYGAKVVNYCIRGKIVWIGAKVGLSGAMYFTVGPIGGTGAGWHL